MSRRILTAVLVPLLLVGSGGAAQTVKVTDGDTLWVGDERVRLWGIDAPEADTPEGTAATRHLSALVGSLPPGALACTRLYLDHHGRTVARCLKPDGMDLACAMVRAGHVREWPRYSGGHYRDCAP